MSTQPPTPDNSGAPDSRPSPIQVSELIRTPASEPATAQQLQAVGNQMSSFERATLKWARLAFFASVLAAGFVCLQWWEMHTGGQDTHDLAQSAELDQRAWLGAGDYTYTITESSPIKSTAFVTNTGKTPAMDILCRITGITRPKGYILTDSDIAYPVDLPILKPGTIFPNQHFPMTAGGPPMDPEKQKTWFVNVKGENWIQYFFGDVRYRDVFGKDHWTHFCTEYVPATNSGTPCPIYNDTDDDKAPKAN